MATPSRPQSRPPRPRRVLVGRQLVALAYLETTSLPAGMQDRVELCRRHQGVTAADFTRRACLWSIMHGVRSWHAARLEAAATLDEVAYPFEPATA